jgi:hypothetical protein
MTRTRVAALASVAVIVAVVTAAFAPAAVSKAKPAKAAATSVVWTVTGTSADGTSFDGALTNVRFRAQRGQMFVSGVLTGTVRDATGAETGSVNQRISTPVGGQAGSFLAVAQSCQILDLVLGPLDLNLLGLVVHLDTVHLNITAESGPGNLLGNLLCAVVNLLNGPAPAQLVARILNAIIALLGG